MKTARCRGCKRTITYSTYGGMGGWEPDYHPHDDPMVWRHSNGYAITGGCPGAEPYPSRAEYVYVASSWRCDYQPIVVETLRAAGIELYDFCNPPNNAGFGWEEIAIPDPCDDPQQYLNALAHPRAIEGFAADFGAMEKADTFVLVLPCNRSAHLELGWAIGMGKRTAIYLAERPITPELMYKMVDYITPSLTDLVSWVTGA